MTDMIAAGRTEIFASPPGTEHNTFTIIGRCERTGMLGICTTTRSLSVGSRVTHGRARVGVIAFQAVADPRMGYLAMRLFDLGYSAPKVVRELQDSDPHAEMRQIAPYYNQRASNPAIAPRSDWLDAQQGQGSAAR